jgi:DNA polymerase III alpha subunit (gram-positive type)
MAEIISASQQCKKDTSDVTLAALGVKLQDLEAQQSLKSLEAADTTKKLRELLRTALEADVKTSRLELQLKKEREDRQLLQSFLESTLSEQAATNFSIKAFAREQEAQLVQTKERLQQLELAMSLQISINGVLDRQFSQ